MLCDVYISVETLNKVKEEYVGMSLNKKIRKLKSETEYAVTVWAHTAAGPGEHYMLTGKTAVATGKA